jgi:hypothetical protein
VDTIPKKPRAVDVWQPASECTVIQRGRAQSADRYPFLAIVFATGRRVFKAMERSDDRFDQPLSADGPGNSRG